MCGLESGSGASFASFGHAVSSTKARSGTYSMYSSNGLQTTIITWTTAVAEIYAQLCFYATGNGNLFQLMDSAGVADANAQLTVEAAVDALRLWRGNKATELDTALPLTLNAWHCVEIHAVIDNSTGAATVVVDGVTQLDYSGDTQATANANTKSIRVLGTAGYVDDIIVNDTTGSYNTSWPNEAGIYPITVTGDGTHGDWDASTGTPETCLEEIPANDADYISTGVDDEQHTFAMSDTAEVGSVLAVKWYARAKKTEAGDAFLLRLLTSAAPNDYVGSNIGLSTSFVEYNEIIEECPWTSAAWTTDDVDAMELGVQAVI
ncbi:MAG TPA: hypothetical protein PK406_00585 [Verrucomicrobiota bacterium]|nr:hypothetical protein [Verrucomicrobiota bacterium]